MSRAPAELAEEEDVVVDKEVEDEEEECEDEDEDKEDEDEEEEGRERGLEVLTCQCGQSHGGRRPHNPFPSCSPRQTCRCRSPLYPQRVFLCPFYVAKSSPEYIEFVRHQTVVSCFNQKSGPTIDVE